MGGFSIFSLIFPLQEPLSFLGFNFISIFFIFTSTFYKAFEGLNSGVTMIEQIQGL